MWHYFPFFMGPQVHLFPSHSCHDIKESGRKPISNYGFKTQKLYLIFMGGWEHGNRKAVDTITLLGRAAWSHSTRSMCCSWCSRPWLFLFVDLLFFFQFSACSNVTTQRITVIFFCNKMEYVYIWRILKVQSILW